MSHEQGLFVRFSCGTRVNLSTIECIEPVVDPHAPEMRSQITTESDNTYLVPDTPDQIDLLIEEAVDRAVTLAIKLATRLGIEANL